MTVNEFFGIRQWMKDRWSSLDSLREGQWTAYFEELKRFDADEVQAALDEYVRATVTPEFPPGVMKLVRMCEEAAIRTVMRHKALPEPHVDSKEALRMFREQHGGRLPSQVHRELDVKGV
jgi:hypothetical protein